MELNEKSKILVELLKEHADGLTLREAQKLAGIEIKTGSVNNLISKGIVNTNTEKSLNCDIVYNGEVIGHKTVKEKVYKLN